MRHTLNERPPLPPLPRRPVYDWESFDDYEQPTTPAFMWGVIVGAAAEAVAILIVALFLWLIW
jgi:hypothetical protein